MPLADIKMPVTADARPTARELLEHLDPVHALHTVVGYEVGVGVFTVVCSCSRRLEVAATPYAVAALRLLSSSKAS